MTINPQRIIQGRYQVVPRTLILVMDQGKVLLQKGAPSKKIWAGLYNGLGGHVEKGEDLLTSAKRELLEEAGIICQELKMFGSVIIDVDDEKGILMFVFAGYHPEGKMTPSEEGSLEWVELEKVQSLPIVEDIPLILRLIQTHQIGSLFFGHYGYDESGKLIAEINLQE